MSTGKFFFTSESVTEGHPDKMADQISDAIFDAILETGSDSACSLRNSCHDGLGGLRRRDHYHREYQLRKIVRDTIAEIGYNNALFGFDSNTCAVMDAIGTQSPDIAQGVDTGGAGDQGLMFGFACNETPELMPLPIQLAHNLTKKLSEVRRSGELDYLRPDGKSQVTIEYRDGKPFRVDAVVISTQHATRSPPNSSARTSRKKSSTRLSRPSCFDDDTKYHINPTGRFVIGGPMGDAGVTGRKIIVDTYGGYAPHGGGAFSGKDPTKVDRSAAYMARYIAKNIVAAGLADKCTVQLAYAIGVAEPVSVYGRYARHRTG